MNLQDQVRIRDKIKRLEEDVETLSKGYGLVVEELATIKALVVPVKRSPGRPKKNSYGENGRP